MNKKYANGNGRYTFGMTTSSVLMCIVVVCIIVVVCLGLYALWKLYWRMAYTRFDIDTCLPCTRNQLIGSIVCIIILVVSLLHAVTSFPIGAPAHTIENAQSTSKS